MILERRQGLLLRAISQLVWRIPGRPAAKMAGFSHTEYGSGLDMLCAAQETPDGELRARFYQHALDELKHARLFKERARALSPARSRAQAVLDDADFIHSHGIRSSESLYQQLGELEFLAFVWIHELNGARQFDVYAELMRDDAASAQMFETIAHDERFHIAYSRRELDKLAKAGQARAVQRAVIQVRLRALYQAWLRFGRWLGNLMASLWLGLVYVLIVGPFSLAGRLAEAPSAGFVPPDPRLTDPVGQALEQGMSRYVLGVSALYHDAAAALLRDGALVAAASEERFSRIKHDAALPVAAARYCLETAGISIDDVEAVVYYEKPLLKFERLLVSHVLNFPKSFKAFQRMAMSWLTDKLWVRNALVQSLGVHPDRLYFCDHHLSHAASAFYCAPAREAAILTVDGVGEWATTTLFKGGPGGIERLSEIRFPHSIGLIYSAFTAYLGFRVNNGEYKVMGMAAYGSPRFEAEVRKVLRVEGDGSFTVDPRYISYHYSATDSFTPALVDLLGPPRFPGAPFDPRTEEGRRWADIAASVQKVTEDCLVAVAGALHRLTGLPDLCLAGGVALNSVANRQILLRTPFERLFVQPAAGDAGGAIGCALWAWREVLGGEGGDVGLRPDLGERFDDEEIAALLADLNIRSEALGEALPARAAEDLADGKVIGWFQGRFEWGPRALGHRSILADPTRAEMPDRINRSVKFREPFRPFAPSALAEASERYFDLPEGGDQPLRWMLLVTPVKEDARATLPAITHADGTARLQAVDAETSPLYHQLISAFGARTGHPVVLNTSFNLKGEPLVRTPLDALATFQRSDLDALYLGQRRVLKADLRGGGS